MKKVIGRFFLFLLIAFIVIGYFIGYVPYLKIKSKAQNVIASAKEMK